jgi:hypothetical protein
MTVPEPPVALGRAQQVRHLVGRRFDLLEAHDVRSFVSQQGDQLVLPGEEVETG